MRILLLVAVALVAAPDAVAAGEEETLRSPPLAPGAMWQLVPVLEGEYAFHSHHATGASGTLVVGHGGSPAVEIAATAPGFSAATFELEPGGTVTWVNDANVTVTIAVTPPLSHDEDAYTTVHAYVIGLLLGGAVVGLVLVGFGLRAFRRTGSASMACVAGAFTLFAFKNALVAWSLHVFLMPHEYLELVDAAGDLGTVMLLAAPVFWGRPR